MVMARCATQCATCAERAGARMVEAEVPFPHPTADAIVANIAGALTSRTRVAVVDHITSGSALVLPSGAYRRVCATMLGFRCW